MTLKLKKKNLKFLLSAFGDGKLIKSKEFKNIVRKIEEK
jgi:hypothetical protein